MEMRRGHFHFRSQHDTVGVENEAELAGFGFLLVCRVVRLLSLCSLGFWALHAAEINILTYDAATGSATGVQNTQLISYTAPIGGEKCQN
jgi:hypothetical protein